MAAQNRKKLPVIIFYIILLTIPLVGIGQPSASPDNRPIKVLCYNIRFGELASLEELADFIKSQNPDLVALQEVDVKTFRSNAPHQNGKDFITELAFRTGMLSTYARTIDYAGGYYGIGILSKYPFVQTKKVLLPMPPGAREQRAFLMADVELPGDMKITFVSTHLDHSTSDVRKAQVEYLNASLQDNPWPVIVAGDFNARPDSPEIKNGMANWKKACNQDFTSPAHAPKSKIDYIFCAPSDRWEAVNAYTPNCKLSDHLPVVAEIRLIRL